MLKFTEKIGEHEFTYEGETVQDIVNLKQAINPNYIRLDGNTLTKEDYNRWLRELDCGSIRNWEKVGAII